MNASRRLPRLLAALAVASLAGWLAGRTAARPARAADADPRAPADPRESLLQPQRRIREEQYQRTANFVARLPPLGVKSIDEVFRLRAPDRLLACSLELPQWAAGRSGQFRLDLDRFKGPTYVQVSYTVEAPRRLGNVAVGPLAAPGEPPRSQRVFQFTTYAMPSPDRLTTLSIREYATSLQVSRSTVSDDGYDSVSLIQQRDPAGKDPFVALSASRSGGTAGGPPRSIALRAGDFHALLRQYPSEAEEFIRPLLRDLGQEAAFAPETAVAWQVFSDRWPPDERMAQRVRALLPSLDDPDYRVRERATAELLATGRDGAAALLHLDRGGLTPQQNLLIDRALAPYMQLPPKAARRLHDDPGFLLDSLYSPDAAIRAAALERLKTVVKGEAAAAELDQFDVEAPESRRSAAVEVLRKHVLGGGPADSTRAGGPRPGS